jgi:hypothetical protein
MKYLLAEKHDIKDIKSATGEYQLQGIVFMEINSPKLVYASATGNMINILNNFNEGAEVDIELLPRSAEHNGKWYTNVILRSIR